MKEAEESSEEEEEELTPQVQGDAFFFFNFPFFSQYRHNGEIVNSALQNYFYLMNFFTFCHNTTT